VRILIGVLCVPLLLLALFYISKAKTFTIYYGDVSHQGVIFEGFQSAECLACTIVKLNETDYKYKLSIYSYPKRPFLARFNVVSLVIGGYKHGEMKGDLQLTYLNDMLMRVSYLNIEGQGDMNYTHDEKYVEVMNTTFTNSGGYIIRNKHLTSKHNDIADWYQ
jgi:hypothetical protein